MKKLKDFAFIVVLNSVVLFGFHAQENPIDKKVQDLIAKMTLEEKVGQLFQVSGEEVTGPRGEKINITEYIKAGKVGSCLNIYGTKNVMRVQKAAIESSRLKIPLLFGLDVIHGYKTVFPAPIALASSWDPEIVRKAQKIAAKEMSSSGVMWTFTPMLDIARDPRWGRVVESFGEDPYLVSVMGRVSVEAFQGESFDKKDSVMATAKHYVGYGAVQAGREYYTVDISKRTLWEIYMPPFKAAVDTHVASVMPAFTTVNGIPMSANKELVNDVLREKWGFQGITVSDWNAIHELINHGVAENGADAAVQGINAGVDIDMVGGDYMNNLAALVKDNKVPVALVDKAVARILKKKFELGLFDNPYKYCDSEKEKEELLSSANREAAREIARESIVLLKNDNNILPLKIKDIKSVAVVGSLAESKRDIIGPWCGIGSEKDTISVLDAIKDVIPRGTVLNYQKGSEIEDNNESLVNAAVNAASKSDIIIAVLGESSEMSGEAASRSSIEIPEAQKTLLKWLSITGKPIVLVLMNGRPLDLSWEDKHIPAILETWFPGTEGGNAIADILFGKHNPSAKLPITFPKSLGQVPIAYNHLMCGRPATTETVTQKYVSKYLDIDNEPLYPFGYGLTYTAFSYSPIYLDKKEIKIGESLAASVVIKNTGKVDGKEVVQLYIRDMLASVARPIMDLKDFKKVSIKSGDSVKISFTITSDHLKFYNKDMEEIIEPGTFEVYIGTNSRDYQKESFKVVK